MTAITRKNYRSKSTNRSLARKLYLTKRQLKSYTARRCKRRTNQLQCISTRSKLTGKQLCIWERGGKRRRALCKRRSGRKKKL